MIKSDITFIIQGDITPNINRQIAEIKKCFPQSSVVVSTSTGIHNCEVVENADRIIMSKDPGFFYYSDRPGEKVNNINRQIVSTLAGLKACHTKYAFKLRSDFFLTGNSFLEYFESFPKSDENYKIFEHKILSCCYFARNPQSDMPFPYHPSDLAFFGKTSDLLKLFDIPLMTAEEAYWDVTNSRFNRYVPEQYLFINCLRKNGLEVNCNFYNDCSKENIEATERFFASNFIFLTFEQFNLKPTTQTFSMKVHPNAFKSCYTHIDWQRLYQKYVDTSLNVPLIDEERLKIEKCYKNYRKYRFLSNLCALPFRNKAKRRQIRNAVLEFFLAK
jgi:hypothetical protein